MKKNIFNNVHKKYFVKALEHTNRNPKCLNDLVN